MKRLILAALFALSFNNATAAARQPEKIEDTEAASCEPANKVCQQLHLLFRVSLTSRGAVGIPVWRDSIRYVTYGLNAEGNALFDDLLAGFAAKAELKVERLPIEQSLKANLTFVATPDLGGAIASLRYGSTGKTPELTPEQRAALTRQFSDTGYIRFWSSTNGYSSTINQCYMALQPQKMEDHPALRMAMLLYRCLTATEKSDAIKPSLANSDLPLALDAPPYAKMAAFDGALLQVLYLKPHILSRGPPKQSMSAIERELRAEGITGD